jgi:hypothetical protein
MIVPKVSFFWFSIALGFSIQPAPAQTPVALVEEVNSRTAGVEFMDYLPTGKVIQLSAGDRLVVGYMKSCWHETITAGTVIIGGEQSEVRGGSVERVRLRCGSAKQDSTAKETSGSGAMVFRKGPATASQTVYALSPVFALRNPGSLVIDRLDRKESGIELRTTQSKDSRGSFLDLAKHNVTLSAGGLYRARSGKTEIIFKVDPSAEKGSASVIGRLVHLAPPG